MQRENVFAKIYQKCNGGTNAWKAEKCTDEEYPKYIDVELTNHCNLNCYMCPVGTYTMKRDRGFMSMKTVEKLCAELKASSIQGVRLIRWGEPTMHPQFLQILWQFKNTGKAVHFNTNGTLLDKESIKRIVELEIDSVKFSFQGVDKESYEEMRAGSSWDKLMENIRFINEARGDNEKPYIQISTTTTTESNEEITKFVQQISALCDHCNVGRTKLCHLDVAKMKISEERRKKYLELKEKERLQKQHFKVCPEIYDKLSINWDGTVTACCADYDNLLIVGDMMQDSLKDIYQGEKIKKIREIISTDDYDAIPLCRTCYDYINLEK